MRVLISGLFAVVAMVGCGNEGDGAEDVHEGLDSAPEAQCSSGQQPNPCGGCGEIQTVARSPQVALSAARPANPVTGHNTVTGDDPIIPGDDCWFDVRKDAYLGPPVWGKLKCLTPTQFYCFFEVERCGDGKDNDQDGLVDECEDGATVDEKYGDTLPLR